MASTWSVIRTHFRQKRENSLPERGNHPQDGVLRKDGAEASAPPSQRTQAGQSETHQPVLDAVGQQTELIRVRMSLMADRLEDVRSLTDEFAHLVEPLNHLIGEFPQLQFKFLEAEALLSQERQAALALRREAEELANQNSNLSGELSTVLTQVRRQEALLRERDAEAEEIRLALRERTTHMEGLERQLYGESERARALTEESQALRGELRDTDQALVRAERDAAEAREQNAALNQDNKRLQDAVRDQAERIIALNAERGDLAQQVSALREAEAALESRLAAEQAARQKIEAQRDAEEAAYRTELSALQAQVQTLGARVIATDRMLSHARAQLLEREDALKAAERANKEAALERGKVERHLAAAQGEINRISAQFDDLNASRAELAQRCDMLTRTVAAKDAAVESATGKVASLSDRLDQLTRRFEQERAALEAQNRRLVEDLQNEKAERSLAQGALEIARESRLRLQKQYAALRQKSRLTVDSGHHPAATRDGGDEAGADERTDSNVRRFPPAEADAGSEMR